MSNTPDNSTTSQSRPPVPDWIRSHIPPSGWTNVFALLPSNEHLYATETLFGDWTGQTLLLAKDAAPTGVIRELRDKRDPRPWRHAQRSLGDVGGYRTNESLAAAAAALPGGKLYGSATANLLFDDPRWSRALQGFYTGPLHDYLARVLAWVIGSMPNVGRVACLGQEAWFLTSVVLGRPELARRFSECRDACMPLNGTFEGRPIAAFALFHPAARVSETAKRAAWMAMNGPVSRPIIESQRTQRPQPMALIRTATVPADTASRWTDAPFSRKWTTHRSPRQPYSRRDACDPEKGR